MERQSLFLAAVFAFFSTTLGYASYPTVNEPFSPPQYQTGWYDGLQLGWGRQKFNQSRRTDSVTGNTVQLPFDTTSGFAGRFNTGYSINPYFAGELGIAGWRKGKDTWFVTDPLGVFLSTGNTRIRNYDIDALIKMMYPFNSGFELFFKAGTAYVISKREVNSSLQLLAPRIYKNFDESVHGFRPEVAIGFSYPINLRWSWDLNYHYIVGRNNNRSSSSSTNSRNALPSLQLLTLGIQYDVMNG